MPFYSTLRSKCIVPYSVSSVEAATSSSSTESRGWSRAADEDTRISLGHEVPMVALPIDIGPLPKVRSRLYYAPTHKVHLNNVYFFNDIRTYSPSAPTRENKKARFVCETNQTHTCKHTCTCMTLKSANTTFFTVHSRAARADLSLWLE